MGLRRSLLIAGGLVAVVAGCGGSGYQYVENEDLGVFARLPDDWAVYDTEALLTEVNPEDDSLSDAALEQAQARLWFRGFDASESPSAEGSMDIGAGEPRGFVHIRALSPEERDTINVSGLRAYVLGVDPLAAPTGTEVPLGGPSAEDVEVITDEPAEFDGGYHGNHNVYAVTQGNDIAIVDQTALLDSASSTLYLFVVSCDDECYFETSSDEIAEIVDSWTIDESHSSQ